MSHDKDTHAHLLTSTAAGYDRVAHEYANRIYRELEAKPFDRAFLDSLARRLPAGNVLDLGCGPGHVGKYLNEQGVPIIGLDISQEMVKIARNLNPQIEFRQGDMREMEFVNESFAGVVAFYSIIHLAPGELVAVCKEVQRILVPGGVFALSFHLGQKVLHINELWGIKTSLDFVLFEREQVVEALTTAGLTGIESSQRAPYDPSVEAQTDRCYVLAMRSVSDGHSGAKVLV
jgi:SAM-dependent methyltransferase